MKNQKIGVAIDLRSYSDDIVANAVEYARAFNSELVLIHIIASSVFVNSFYNSAVLWDSISNEIHNESEVKMKEIAKTTGYEKISVIVKEGEPASAIASVLKENNIDMLILGSHKRTGLEHFVLGSDAEKIIKLTEDVPVLVLKV